LEKMMRSSITVVGLIAYFLASASAQDKKRELTERRIVGTWVWRFDDTGQDLHGRPVAGTVESRWIFTESRRLYFTFQFKSLDGQTTRKASNGRYIINPTGNIVVSDSAILNGDYRIEWVDENTLMMYNGGSTGPFTRTD
jgi:hypothetical protein